MLSPHTHNSTQSSQNKDRNQQFSYPQGLSLTDPVSAATLATKTQPLLKTKNSSIGTGAKFPFNSSANFSLANALSMTQDHLDGARIPDHRLSVAPSSALDAADLQFSGYLLSGSYGSLGRTGYSYGLNTSHVDVQGDGSSRRLLETLGMAGMHSFGSQLASSRSNSVMSPTSGKHVSTPGVSGSLSTTPFATTPHQSFSSTSNIMPLTGHSSYASLLNKANLLFENNLDSMMLNW
ncbi:hypothetical protein BX070DRAFT_235268 [Coemansia spiralis]|nr:hypothetical protein BX070DRAFT_235268 [Coemansia spiralis]